MYCYSPLNVFQQSGFSSTIFYSIIAILLLVFHKDIDDVFHFKVLDLDVIFEIFHFTIWISNSILIHLNKWAMTLHRWLLMLLDNFLTQFLNVLFQILDLFIVLINSLVVITFSSIYSVPYSIVYCIEKIMPFRREFFFIS